MGSATESEPAPAGIATAAGLGLRDQRRLAVATAAVALAGAAVVAAADPSVPGRYGLCPMWAVTGWWCPLCGSLRAVHALAHGDVTGAADANVVFLVALPLAVAAWAAWTASVFGLRRPSGWRPSMRMRMGLLAVAAVGLTVFGVARNLSAFAWLAPVG